ncbi:hypothetical protein FHX05_003107 [Rhizobium sp. BK491]|nr:hypothetical protein [Rhizobium sp. BK491]
MKGENVRMNATSLEGSRPSRLVEYYFQLV